METEAYVSHRDLACHASKGRTPRTEVLFGPPGRAYVYLIYGMYHCLNAVTGPDGTAAAVLIRAAEPLSPDLAPMHGPGRLCRSLAIDLQCNRHDLTSGEAPLWIGPRTETVGPIARGPRIGVDYAGAWAAKPYRFGLRGSPFMSRPWLK